MANDEELAVVLSLKDEFSRQMSQPIKQMELLQKGAASLGRSFKTAGIAVAGGVALMARNIMNVSEELVRLNKITGVGIEKLQKLGFAAELNESSLQAVSIGFRQLARQAQEAMDGTGEAAETFKRLGVNVKDAGGNLKNVEQIFNETVDGISKMTNSTEQQAAALRLFGRAGTDLLPLIKEGTAGFDKFGKIAEDLGIIIKTDTVEALESFGDQMTILKKAGQSLVAEGLLIIAESLPVLIEGFGGFVKTVNATKNTLMAFASDVSGSFGVAKKAVIAIGETSLPGMIARLVQGENPIDKARKSLIDLGLSVKKLGKESEDSHKQAEDATKDDARSIEEYKQKVLNAIAAVKGLGDEQKKTAEASRELNAALGIGAKEVDAAFEGQKAAAQMFRLTGDQSKFLQEKLKAAEDAYIRLGMAIEQKGSASTQEQKDLETLKILYTKAKGELDSYNQKQEDSKKAIEESSRATEELRHQMELLAEQDPFTGMEMALRDLSDQLPNFRQLFGSVFRTMEQSLSNAFESMISGTSKLKDIMKNLFNDIKRSFIKMVSDLLAQQLMKQLAGMFLGLGVSTPGVAQVAGGAAGGQQTMAGQTATGATQAISGLSFAGAGGTGGITSTSFGSATGAIMGIGGMTGMAVYNQGMTGGDVNVGQSTAGMAMTGAALGAVAGPIGMAVGAVAGAAVGYFTSSREKDKQKKAEKKAHAQEKKMMEKAAKLFKMELTTKYGGGLATEEQAAAIGEIMSGDVTASDLKKLGIDPRQVLAREGEIRGQAASNNINMGGVQISLSIGSLASHYDVKNVAEDLAYHLQNSLNDAAASNE